MKWLCRVLVLVIVSLSGALWAQDDLTDKESIRNKQRVNYIYNFTEFISWKEDHDPFVIGVLGANEEALVDEFRKSATKRTVKGSKVKILYFETVDQIEKTQILFIHNMHRVNLTKVLTKMYANNTLLVTENFEFGLSMINFMEFGEEFHFSVNSQQLREAGLLVAPRLLNYSIQEQKDWDELYRRLTEERNLIDDQSKELLRLQALVSEQEGRLKLQRARIIKQQSLINGQKLKYDLQQEDLDLQIKQVQNQRKQLESLYQEIEDARTKSERVASELALQREKFNKRQNKLRSQAKALMKQENRLKSQELSINEQEKLLNNQLDKIEQQGYLIYAFGFLFLLIGVLAFFVRLEYKRKRRSEYRVKQQNARLVTLNESLDSFVYRVSHDLKAPVINVKNMISMLKEFQGSDDKKMVAEIINNLDTASVRLETTITDLLELSRIERVREKKEIVSIKEVWNELIVEYSDRLSEIDAVVNVNMNRTDSCHVSRAEMMSIFQNLLTNSLKYRSPMRSLEISVSTEQRGDELLLTFKDNGRGIDLAIFKDKLFEMFQRFTDDVTISGTGVGMYIIKKLIDKNGGRVELESNPGEGLTYFIYFPIKAFNEKN